jgi:hypothetical protein
LSFNDKVQDKWWCLCRKLSIKNIVQVSGIFILILMYKLYGLWNVNKIMSMKENHFVFYYHYYIHYRSVLCFRLLFYFLCRLQIIRKHTNLWLGDTLVAIIMYWIACYHNKSTRINFSWNYKTQKILFFDQNNSTSELSLNFRLNKRATNVNLTVGFCLIVYVSIPYDSHILIYPDKEQ